MSLRHRLCTTADTLAEPEISSGTDPALQPTLQILVTFISSAQGRSQLPSLRPAQSAQLGRRWQWLDSNQESALTCSEHLNRISNAWHCNQQR